MLDAVAHPAGALLSAFQASGSLPQDINTESVVNMIMDDGLDGERIGAAADIFVRKLGTNMDLFAEILKHTTRDGVPLSAQFNFDAAYTGNYMELFAAIGWAVQVNFGSMLGAYKFPFGGKGSGPKVKLS